MKKWYQSKTVWANVALVLGAVIQMLPQLQVTMTPEQYGMVFFAFGTINLVLRKLTTTGITK